MNDPFANDDVSDASAETQSPRHGFRGEPPPAAPMPAGLTIAVSREAGARGGSLGRRVARSLGWDVYGQELLDYIARDPTSRQDVLQRLSSDEAVWVENRLQHLVSSQELSQNPTILSLARVILALGAKGQVVFIGRGAGHILPRETTLHVRIVAPLADRIAYLAQWLRLTIEEATEQVRVRDSRRQEFLSTHFHQGLPQSCLYDLVLNSTTLGEGLCADLILQAARAKQAALTTSETETA
jgi:hypothetical protein